IAAIVYAAIGHGQKSALQRSHQRRDAIAGITFLPSGKDRDERCWKRRWFSRQGVGRGRSGKDDQAQQSPNFAGVHAIAPTLAYSLLASGFFGGSVAAGFSSFLGSAGLASAFLVSSFFGSSALDSSFLGSSFFS